MQYCVHEFSDQLMSVTYLVEKSGPGYISVMYAVVRYIKESSVKLQIPSVVICLQNVVYDKSWNNLMYIDCCDIIKFNLI